MKKAEIEGKVTAIVSDILGGPVGLDASMDATRGWDSLKHMQIIFAFEETFGIRLGADEVANLSSVKALVARAESCV